MTLRISVPIYYTFEYKTKKDKKVLQGLNHYRNCNPFSLNKIKKHYHELVAEQVRGQVLDTPLYVQNRLYLRSLSTDGHNVAPIIMKYVLDGLVECGVIPDDNAKHILGDSTLYFLDKENPRCEITLVSSL